MLPPLMNSVLPTSTVARQSPVSLRAAREGASRHPREGGHTDATRTNAATCTLSSHLQGHRRTREKASHVRGKDAQGNLNRQIISTTKWNPSFPGSRLTRLLSADCRGHTGSATCWFECLCVPLHLTSHSPALSHHSIHFLHLNFDSTSLCL